MRIPVRLKVHKRLISSISIAESMGLVAGLVPRSRIGERTQARWAFVYYRHCRCRMDAAFDLY